MEEYRFQTTDVRGTVRLAASEVEVDVKHVFSQWNYAIPYDELRPYPMHYRTTESSVWLCLILGLGAIAAGITYFFEVDKHYLPLWMYPLIALGGLGLIIYAYLHRRCHWVTFSSSRNHYISFAREGLDTAKFDEFVSSLKQRIQTSQPTSNQVT